MSEESKSNAPDTPAPIGEIEHGPSKFDVFMEKNLKKLILLALLIIVGVAAFVIMSQLGEAKEREAGNALLAAEDPEGYRKVAADYPDSPAAGSANLLLAGQLWDEGKEEEAMKTLAASAGKEGPAALQAKFALAGMKLKSGETDEAKSAYESLLSDSDAKYLHPASLIALGDIAKAAGDDEKAREYYQRKIDDYPTYGIQSLAVTRLNLVGVDEAVKVPPPPAPEPTPNPNSGISPTFTNPIPLPAEGMPAEGANIGIPELAPIEINPAELTPLPESSEENTAETTDPPSEAATEPESSTETESQPEGAQPDESEPTAPAPGETPTFEE